MKKYIEFFMRKSDLNFTVDEERALAILKSPDQIVIIKDEKGVWHGDSINKSEIIGTKLNREKTRDENEKLNPKLEEPKTFVSKGVLEKFKPSFLK